jgi:hypothetical protein
MSSTAVPALIAMARSSMAMAAVKAGAASLDAVAEIRAAEIAGHSAPWPAAGDGVVATRRQEQVESWPCSAGIDVASTSCVPSACAAAAALVPSVTGSPESHDNSKRLGVMQLATGSRRSAYRLGDGL